MAFVLIAIKPVFVIQSSLPRQVRILNLHLYLVYVYTFQKKNNTGVLHRLVFPLYCSDAKKIRFSDAKAHSSSVTITTAHEECSGNKMGHAWVTEDEAHFTIPFYIKWSINPYSANQVCSRRQSLQYSFFEFGRK